MTLLALMALAVWVYLLAFRDGFWRARETDAVPCPPPPAWPAVTAIVPARDEAAVIGRSIASLLAQDYPGALRVIVVDDRSSDGTAALAREAAGEDERLSVIDGAAPPEGWTGKLWAVEQGLRAAGTEVPWLWLTDADIVHAPDTLRSLVSRGSAERLTLNSLMALLEREAAAERALIPAFVFFFMMLYPFARVNRGEAAAAAGGCMLVDRAALARAGGLEQVRHEIIDDCALGRLLGTEGPIRLSLTRRSRSIRPYAGWRGIGRMIARSAYAQLGYSPLALVGTVAGMALAYLVPPLAVLSGPTFARVAGLVAWGLMAFAFQPTLRLYGRSPWWGPALPAIAVFYTGATVASAIQHARGRGGLWKGRAQAARTS